MLYQLNYIHHLWDCKGSIFSTNYPNIYYLSLYCPASNWMVWFGRM